MHIEWIWQTSKNLHPCNDAIAICNNSPNSFITNVLPQLSWLMSSVGRYSMVSSSHFSNDGFISNSNLHGGSIASKCLKHSFIPWNTDKGTRKWSLNHQTRLQTSLDHQNCSALMETEGCVLPILAGYYHTKNILYNTDYTPLSSKLSPAQHIRFDS